jgi:hypothetical protein
MADPKEIERELLEYLKKEPNIRSGDRIQYLMAIINKHFELDKMEHVMTHYDFDQLISVAKTSFAQKTMPVFISCKEVHSSEIPHILMIEALIGYLNRHKLLKRLIQFDYRR